MWDNVSKELTKVQMGIIHWNGDIPDLEPEFQPEPGTVPTYTMGTNDRGRTIPNYWFQRLDADPQHTVLPAKSGHANETASSRSAPSLEHEPTTTKQIVGQNSDLESDTETATRKSLELEEKARQLIDQRQKSQVQNENDNSNQISQLQHYIDFLKRALYRAALDFSEQQSAFESKQFELQQMITGLSLSHERKEDQINELIECKRRLLRKLRCQTIDFQKKLDEASVRLKAKDHEIAKMWQCYNNLEKAAREQANKKFEQQLLRYQEMINRLYNEMQP